MWLPVKLEDFSRSPSNSAVSHIKQVATQERDNTFARGVLLRPFLNNGYRLRKAVMSPFFYFLTHVVIAVAQFAGVISSPSFLLISSYGEFFACNNFVLI